MTKKPPPFDALFSDEDRALIAKLDHGLTGIYAASRAYWEHYDRAGNPITFGTWSVLFSKFAAYRLVCQTWTHSGAWVTTVWMGLNHQWLEGPPLIFETMVFHDGEDLHQVRYSSEAAAIAGHEALVEQYGGRDHDGPQS